MGLAAIASQVVGGAVGLLRGRQESATLWEQRRIANDGWTDEFWSVVLAAPLVVIQWGVLTNRTELIERQREALEVVATMPEWYVGGLGLALAYAFARKGYQIVQARKRPHPAPEEGSEHG